MKVRSQGKLQGRQPELDVTPCDTLESPPIRKTVQFIEAEALLPQRQPVSEPVLYKKVLSEGQTVTLCGHEFVTSVTGTDSETAVGTGLFPQLGWRAAYGWAGLSAPLDRLR